MLIKVRFMMWQYTHCTRKGNENWTIIYYQKTKRKTLFAPAKTKSEREKCWYKGYLAHAHSLSTLLPSTYCTNSVFFDLFNIMQVIVGYIFHTSVWHSMSREKWSKSIYYIMHQSIWKKKTLRCHLSI